MNNILDFVTIKEYEHTKPLNMLHKEQDEEAVKNIEGLKNVIQNLHVLFRSSVNVEAKSEVAKLLITADDYYKLYINGRFIAQGPAPAYPENYYYNEIDISKYLGKGENSIAVHLYYQGLINRVWNSGDNRLLLGTNLSIGGAKVPLKWFYKVSDAFSGGIIGYDTQFLEDFDSRKWDDDWCSLGNYKEQYMKAVPAAWADYNLSKQPTDMLDVYKVVPVKTEETVIDNKRKMFIDFGKEITGTLKLKALGKLGSQVIIRCGEELLDNKSKTVRHEMRCNCNYEEKWTLRDGKSIYDGYDYKGFRYAELIYDDEVKIEDVSAVMRHYPFDDEYCKYKGNDEKLKAIFDLCKYTVKLGTQDNYVDCPTREKGQYLGDAIITARAHVHLTGRTEMLRKCIEQFAMTKDICPGLMAVAPGALMQEIGDFSLLWSELLLTDYYFTKDRGFLRRFYPVAADLIKHFSQYENETGLLDCVADKWNLVDWPENLRDGYDFALTRPVVGKGCHNVMNALYVGAMINLSRIEELLGLEKTYDIEGRIKKFNDAFFDKKTGLYRDSLTSAHSSLHSNVYPYYFGLVSKEQEESIGDFIVKKGLNCGTFLSYFAIKSLIFHDRKADAYSLLTNDTEHGWMNMLKEGATTAFEAWGKEQKWNTSLCHPWAAGPVSIILEDFS